MKIALVHDHLAQDGGAEKVLHSFHKIWPKAPIFILLYDKDSAPKYIPFENIQTSFIQKLPGGIKNYKWYLPFMPTAIEKFDLMAFDVVLSISSALAKGVITAPHSLHISYTHTPTRYLWSDTHKYIEELPYRRIMKKIIPFCLTYLRMWDRMAADRVDHFIANSGIVKQRIRKYYKHESDVIFPPVDTTKFTPAANPTRDYFLVGGRLVPYKRFDIAIQAFNRLKIPLKVFGAGPDMARLKSMAGKNITFVGRVSGEELATLYQDAKALIFPQVEDFGIVPLEAMAAGTPVIAYKAGGALETVVAGKTGIFFEEQGWGDLSKAVVQFKSTQFDAKTIRAHAEKFSTEIFEKNIKEYVEGKWKQHKSLFNISLNNN